MKNKERGERKKKLLGVTLLVRKELDDYSEDILEVFIMNEWVCGC